MNVCSSSSVGHIFVLWCGHKGPFSVILLFLYGKCFGVVEAVVASQGPGMRVSGAQYLKITHPSFKAEGFNS